MILDWKNKVAAAQITDADLHPFIFHEGSLTRLIQDACDGEFGVKIQSADWSIPLSEEAELLGLPLEQEVFVRESWLQCNLTNLIFARSIIPAATLTGKLSSVTELGEGSLGELLFAENDCERTEMRFARLTESCELYQHIIPQQPLETIIWVRQSLFRINRKPLLIMEVFLPVISQCMHN